MTEQENMTKMTEEKIKKLTQDVANLPPFTGDMAKDFTGLLLKELAALSKIWTEYLSDQRSNSNILITNHIATMQTQYDRLLTGVQMVATGFFDENGGSQTSNPEEG